MGRIDDDAKPGDSVFAGNDLRLRLVDRHPQAR